MFFPSLDHVIQSLHIRCVAKIINSMIDRVLITRYVEVKESFLLLLLLYCTAKLCNINMKHYYIVL